MYFDYSATTKCSNAVLEAFIKANEDFANPNSLHPLGLKVHSLIDESSKKIASCLGCKPNEIIYTSGASEANNLAVLGLCSKYPNKKHIITTSIEHSSIIAPYGYLSRNEYDVDMIKIKADGTLDLDHFRSLLTKDTLLVSCIYVNSEVGIINPIEEMAEILKDYPDVIFHVDATQAIGKINVNLACVDMLSLSAHKIFGIKGIGALIKKERVNLNPIIFGGKSTTIYRSGTPSFPLIKSLEVAILNALDKLDEHYEYVLKLKHYLISKLNKNILINSNEACSPYILNISILNHESKDIQKYLADRGIYVSTQTACSSDARVSRTILNMFNDEERAKSSIRISLSYVTNYEEVDTLIDVLNGMYEGN